MIANIILQLVTQAQSQGKIWTQLPIILREDSEVVLINPRFRLARSYRELCGASAECPNLGLA